MSVLGHAAIVAGLTFSLPLASPERPGMPDFVPIEAVMVNTEAIAEERARLEEIERAAREEADRVARQQREAEERAAAEAQARREAEAEAVAEAERLRLQQAADARAEAERVARLEQEQREQERRDAERRAEEERKAEAERQRIEAERLAAEKAAAEQRRREEEARIRQQLIEAEVARAIAEETAVRAAEDAGLKEEWIRAIENKIRRNWSQPPSAELGLECVVAITQIPSGDVTGVTVERCNGNEVVRRSIIQAVERASPLPPPPVPQLFTRDLRVTFRPDE